MTIPGESWGRTARARDGPVAQRLSRHDPVPGRVPWLAWGHGRSYGDVPCNAPGTLIDVRSADRILHFDSGAGVIRCESGALLGSIQARIIPYGWFLPVVPGTELATLGGAVANDVHGKNHHVAGSVGHHVTRLEIVRSTGERIVCGPEDGADWFRATVGGLGLTGLISWLELRLRRVPGGGWLEAWDHREPNLDALLERLRECDEGHEYTAAWFDCLAPSRSLGRGVVSAADHARSRPGAAIPGYRRYSIPVTPPITLVYSPIVRMFNAGYYWRHPRIARRRVSWYQPVLHPLDGLSGWNRLYGPRGFLQCQVVIPETDHGAVLENMLGYIKASNAGSSLAVLKRFGDVPPVGCLSFPRAGYTLALDFPRRGPESDKLVRELYELALDAGGAIYPAKDAVMTREQFVRSFPGSDELRAWRDPGVASDFGRRVGLV